MKVAIPVSGGVLCAHFGHCEHFTVIDIDEQTKQVVSRKDITPPAHEPGVLPKWLHEMGISIIIAGGMGQRAQMLFQQNNIEVITGAPSECPEILVTNFLNNKLETGQNLCDH